MQKTKVRVWWHRSRALIWLVFGLVSYPLGWSNSIALVWFASVYANVISDIGASEAADDSQVMQELHAIRVELRKTNLRLQELLTRDDPSQDA